MYFTDENHENEPKTPLKEAIRNTDSKGSVQTPQSSSLTTSDGAGNTIRKKLLTSTAKKERQSPRKEFSSSSSPAKRMKTPVKSPSAKSTKSSGKKSAKKTPTMTVKKKKRIAELESQIQAIEESLTKLKREKATVKSRITKLAKAESEIKFPIKDELIEKLDIQGRPLVPLPDPLLKLEDLLPNEAIHDAIAVWNFINAFNKQLTIVSISWDDFMDLLKFTHFPSQALIDLFCAPLRLILSDSLSLNRLQATVPKKVHFSHRYRDAEAGTNTSADGPLHSNSSAPSTLLQQSNLVLNNIEEFDNLYNGLKILPRKLKVEYVDSLRWNSILRCLFLRLEPIRQLRRAVSEATLALQFYQDQAPYSNDSVSLDASAAQFISTLKELNRRYYFIPHSIWSDSKGSDDASAIYNNRRVLFETPKKKSSSDDVESLSETRSGSGSAHFKGKKIELNAQTMSRINTPKSKSRNKASGLNKDAIFNISSNFVVNLQDYYEIAQLLEKKEVHELSPKHKLTILKALCDACMDTERIQQLMEHNAEERANQIQQMNRLAKEQKVKMKEVTTAKREAALEACRRLNREKSVVKGGKQKENDEDGGSGKKKVAKGGKANYEPSIEQLSAMIDDLIALEAYGIDTVREDPLLEEISDSEEEDEDSAEEDELEDGGEDGSQQEKRGRVKGKRKPATARTRARSRQRSRAEKLQRNNTISYAMDKISSALERNTERELRNAIKVAEKSGFRGIDEKTGAVFVTESLKQVYRQLTEMETKANEDKIASKHEKALEEFFVRTEPLGTDRYHRIYWQFMADENRLFVESREEDDEMKEFGPCPPVPSSSAATDQVVLNRLFQSRPNRFKYRWTVYSTPSELWKLCEALDDRGEREKDLKAAIKARYEIEPPAVVYQSTGSEFIGRKVRRTFGRKTVYGTVVGWLPPTEEDQALWHVVHLDGDEEDLDEDELQSALLEEDSLIAREVFSENKVENLLPSSLENGLQNQSSGGINDNRKTASLGSAERIEERIQMEEDGGDAVDEDSVKDRSHVFVPAVVKKASGLSRSGYHSRNASGLYGVMGLSQECQRFLSIITESLKKRLGDRFSREERKVFEQRLRNAEEIDEIRDLILQLEELIHSCQARVDRREVEESAAAKEEERKEMITEGWIFDEAVCEYIGKHGRRYFRKFGLSDGRITAMLPAEKNDGVSLYRLVHSDGDREDLDENDLLTALRYFELNLTEAEITAELKENNQNTVEGEDEDEDEDDEDDLLVDDSSQLSDLQFNDDGLLWPSGEVRQRWIEIVSQAQTNGELALAVASLEEHTFEFGLFGESDHVFPLTLFSPPGDFEAQSSTSKGSRYPQRQRENVQIFHHEALSPRKAKKRAISEISRCQKEENTVVSVEDGEPRRSKRVAGTAQISSNHSSSNNLQFYNSGRPSRSTVQKVVSYAV